MKCGNEKCKNEVVNRGDHLCPACVKELVRRINDDRWLYVRASESMARPS